MPISSIVKTKRDGELVIGALGGGAFDGAGALLPGATSLTVAFEAGDFNLTIPGPGVNLFLDRGQLGSPPALRYGDDQPMTFAFSAYMRDLSDAAWATLEEILMQSGDVGANWESTLASSAGAGDAEVFTVDLKWTIEGTDHGDSADHVIVIPHCVLTGSLTEGDPNSISVSGTAYALFPTIVS